MQFHRHNTENTDSETSIVLPDGTLTDPSDERSLTIPVPQQLLLLSVILFLLLGGAVVPTLLARDTNSAVTPSPNPTSVNSPASTAETEAIQDTIDTEPFTDLAITAESAFVFDVATQRVLYEKNPDTQLPLASLNKLMTALVAYELLQETDTITIDTPSLSQHGNSGFYEFESFTPEALFELVLTASSNDGAYALAQAAGGFLGDTGAGGFVTAMNIRAEELGLTNTTFRNPTGLDESSVTSGGDGSARDITFLMQHIISNHPELLTATTEGATSVYSEDGFRHDAANTNLILDDLPGLIGSKTGYTDLAGGNLTIAFNAGLNRPVIVTVLGSSFYDRFTDVESLVAATLQSVNNEAEQY